MNGSPQPDDTIVAVSTPPGRSGIGVVRLSGESVAPIVSRLFDSPEPPTDRLARYGVFRNVAGSPLDEVVVTVFNAPRSYTGEDVAEISAHGNPVVLGRILEAVVEAGARQASPGEFTLRAVAHGKMDLAQAEAVRDFIAAQTDAQARTAMLQMDGALSRQVGPDKEALVGIIAELEAGIDFAEDDVPLPDTEALHGRIRAVAESVGQLLASFGYGRLLAEGLSLTIAGKPNTGKSSIFNALTSKGRAIVTDVPGTTRDVLTETTTAIAGIPLRFADTAGVRETSDRVESIGVGRSYEAMAEADLTLIVLDSSRPIDADDERVIKAVGERPHLIIVNKSDLSPVWEPGRFPGALYVSARTGAGMDALRDAIERHVVDERPAGADDFVITSRRQRDALDQAVTHLRAASGAVRGDTPHEMVLLDLYSALSSLGELTGEVTTDDILDRVFSTFCIGK